MTDHDATIHQFPTMPAPDHPALGALLASAVALMSVEELEHAQAMGSGRRAAEPTWLIGVDRPADGA